MASFESLPTEVAQKCVEFLAFGEVTEWPTEVKSVSRGLRKAARWALTRGRWRPIRFVSEHGLDTLKKLRGGLNMDEYRQFGVPMHYRHLTAIAQAFSDNWQDRAKARSFVAEAGRIQRAWARRSFPGTYQLEEEPLG